MSLFWAWMRPELSCRALAYMICLRCSLKRRSRWWRRTVWANFSRSFSLIQIYILYIHPLNFYFRSFEILPFSSTLFLRKNLSTRTFFLQRERFSHYVENHSWWLLQHKSPLVKGKLILFHGFLSLLFIKIGDQMYIINFAYLDEQLGKRNSRPTIVRRKYHWVINGEWNTN